MKHPKINLKKLQEKIALHEIPLSYYAMVKWQEEVMEEYSNSFIKATVHLKIPLLPSPRSEWGKMIKAKLQKKLLDIL